MIKHFKYLLHVLRDFLLYYVVSGVFVLLVMFIFMIFTGGKKIGDVTTEFLSDLVILLVVILLFGLYKKNIRTELFKQPLDKIKILKLVVFSIAARITLLIAVTILLFIGSFFFGNMLENILDKGIEYQWAGFEGAGTVETVLGFVAFVILGPIQEELFFRGVVFEYLKKHYSSLISVLYASVVFSLAHFHPGLYFSSFSIGLLLTFVYLRWKNIWYCIILHILFNLQPFIFMMIPGLK